MKIAIAFRPPLRRWQSHLATALRDCGHTVIFARDVQARSWSAVEVAMTWQQRIFGPHPSLFDRVLSDDEGRSIPIDAHAVEVQCADLLIALDGFRGEATHWLELTLNGKHGDMALLEMVASNASPCVQLHVDNGSSVIVRATLAIEDRETLSRAVDQVLARIVSLILQAVRRLEAGRTFVEETKTLPLPGRPLAHMTRGLARKVIGRLSRGRRRPAHWRIGYRRSVGGDDAVASRAWSAMPYSIIPDDGSRFYADPIPFWHAGRSYMFVEDFPYATGKGVIGVVEVGTDGVSLPPRMVLEQPRHLSYPFLIRYGREIYMLPEMSGAGRVQLFRADPFPDRWVPDRVLVEGIVAADATVAMHDGRWWMFATLSDDGGSSWDQLALFHAPDLFGPWAPHVDNPVLVDAGAARPAGAMWHENGVLMRVAQDCRRGYGDGLAICRVDRIDEVGYAQTVVARLAPPDGTEADGVHTLGRDGDLEVIDLRFSSAGR